MRAWLIALVLGGCGFSENPSNAPVLDGGGDPKVVVDAVPIDTPVERICVGTFVQVCVDAPQAALTLTSQAISTSTSPMCVPAITTPAITACVITGRSITIPGGNTVTVTGTRPLILLSTSTMTIDGVLDASSNRNQTGPAADTGPCQANATPPTNSGGQGGGGVGGSFGGPGNNGGTGASGGIGGIAAAPGTVAGLTGGCAGGRGANNDGGRGAGDGGHSGGAVLLLASQALTINGTVNASGRGGSGGSGGFGIGGGGGGGGSGGMIVLEAAPVTVPGKCYANGGGGGEASNIIDGSDGGESSAPDKPGGGGKGRASTGGDGGDGGFVGHGSLGGSSGAHGNLPGPGDGGGGGGGGGAGVLKIFSAGQPPSGDATRAAAASR